jgi:hypothetical protein
MQVSWFVRKNLISSYSTDAVRVEGGEHVVLRPTKIVAHADARGVDEHDFAVVLGDDHGVRIACDLFLEPGTDQRRFGTQKGHALALHVRAHERAVGVVVLEERDERGCGTDDLIRRHVHERDFAGCTTGNSLPRRHLTRSST